MAVTFVHATDPDKCVGCGACVEVCPVDAIRSEDELAVVDREGCIGCGVYATRCESEASAIRERKDQAEIPSDIETLHNMIILEDLKWKTAPVFQRTG
jgi:ferredoxin